MNSGNLILGVRWFARVSSLVSLIVLWAFVFGDQEPQEFASRAELVGFAFFPLSVVVGFLLAWRWELFGALLSLVGLGGFYVWHFVGSGSWPSGPWFLIFAAPAFVFLMAAFLNKTARTTE